MSPHENHLAYRQAAVCGASAIDLVITLYGLLANDLQEAIAAMQVRDIELRTKKLKHALLVLQQLEGRIDPEAGDLARGLMRLYAGLRDKIVEAQIKQDADILHEQIHLVSELRAAWERVNQSEPLAIGPEPISFASPVSVERISSMNFKA